MFVVESLLRVVAVCRRRVHLQSEQQEEADSRRVRVPVQVEPQQAETEKSSAAPASEPQNEEEEEQLSPEELKRMTEPIPIGSSDLVLPFVRADFRRLALVERALLARRQKAAAGGAGASAPATATADAPLSAEEEAVLGEKVLQLATLLREGGADEEQWKALVELDEGMLYRGLLAVLVSLTHTLSLAAHFYAPSPMPIESREVLR
jgi:hypothetical protein